MKPNATVIGTIFVDCKGFARQNYHATGRNLGDIKFVHGGVGRNVAENLANLGIPTTFVSSVDQSADELFAPLGQSADLKLSPSAWMLA